MTDRPPPPLICERCWAECRPGERFAQFGHIVGSTLHGDVQWVYTYLHVYDRDEGCVRGTTSVWD